MICLCPGDALSICQTVKANRGKVIVQVDRLVDTPSRPRNAIIPGCLVDAIVVAEPEKRNEAYTALTGSFEIPYKDWYTWSEKIENVSTKPKRTVWRAISLVRELHRNFGWMIS